jgi:hypothetical protein
VEDAGVLRRRLTGFPCGSKSAAEKGEIMQRSTWMVAAVTLALGIGSAAGAADQTGWAVRICRGETEASAIKIEIGSGKSKDERDLVNWKSDDMETTFVVPAPYATAKTLKVEADSEPGDGKVVMCVLWNGAPAKTMKFKDELEATVKQGAKDDSCPCK